MAILHSSSNTTPDRRPVGRFVAVHALIWMLAAPVLGAAVARVAVWVENFRAPLVIFPLLVGCGLGLALAALMRVGQIGHRATIWSGAVVAVAVTVLGQHFFSFLDFKAAVAAQKPQGISLEAFEAVQEMRPDGSPNFARFMQRQATEGRPMNAGFNGWFTTGEYRLRGMAAWASWGVDGLLMLAATSTVVYLASRRPYCSVCRSWYRTTRAGPLAADRARQMAKAALLPVEDPLRGGQYRLSHCVSGCGPCRLELACRGRVKTAVVEAWLSAAQLGQVVRVLDGESREES